MKEDNGKKILDYISLVKKHDETGKGPITSSIIEEHMNYCKRQFDRIFKNYSKYTPLQIAERFRLIRCVENIRKGHTLFETALQYDFTPEGLSNAIRTKLGLNVKKIQRGKFNLEKHIKISTSMVQLDDYRYRIDEEMYFEFLKGLDVEKILRKITSSSREAILNEGVELHLDSNKVTKTLEQFHGFEIDKETYENLDMKESVIMYVLCEKERISGNNEFEMRPSELASCFFLISFFFNVETLNLKNNCYTFKIREGLKIILEALKEINEVMNEPIDIVLNSTVKGNTVITEFNALYKEALLILNNPTQ